MALTNADIKRYVKIAWNVNSFPRRISYLSYDAQADVVYINFYNPAKPADDSELTDDDVIIRYDEQGKVVGLTILHASLRHAENKQVSRKVERVPSSWVTVTRIWSRPRRTSVRPDF